MYDTGDQAKVLPGGEFEFQGRDDDQVKISGVRIELGSVESALTSCVGVSGCTVIVQTAAGGHKSLVAFVVNAEASRDQTSEAELRRAVRAEVVKKVPKHEVPHRIVVIEKMPLSVAGKADRKALCAIMEREDAKRQAGARPL